MNHKGLPSFVFSVYTKRQSHLLPLTPKDVTPLCPVIQSSRPSLENFYNQESISWKTFCKNGGEEENRIAQVFAQ